jgi:hypothetical protein
MSMAEGIGLAPVAGKQYKVFLVEVDDEDRERVLSGLVQHCEIAVDPQWENVHSEYYSAPVRSFVTNTDVTVTLKLRPREDGTYFTIENYSDAEGGENFNEEPESEDIDIYGEEE